MSLLEEQMEKCTMIDKTTVSDGYGGSETTWVDGASIMAAFAFNNTLEARVAEKQGVTDVFTIVTKKNVNLRYHDVLRRERDKKIFRVTSDGDDNKTPASASLNMRVVNAEEWEIPKDE